MGRGIGSAESDVPEGMAGIQPWLVWTASFGAWMLVFLAASAESYEWWKSHGDAMSWASNLGLQASQVLTYAPLTPLVFALATRFPIEKTNWLRRSFLHLWYSVAFSIAHVALRGLTPFAAWDPKVHRYVSAVWNSQAHIFQIRWHIFENLFLSNLVDDITGTYLPIVLIAQVCLYYRRLRDREVHSAQLEMQLARSHLHALKSHLRPHFLFNTMHSISALMLTDVNAADKMMSRLSDLLRMSFETNRIQITTLNRELEFLNGYLEIEKIRLGQRLNLVLDIAPETLDAQVPSLLLQPLVENAIRHGISKLSSGGTIWIISSRDGHDLHLQIKDNGPGLAKVNDVPSRTGFGLRTTRERLQTLYGNRHRFEISSAAGGGVEVSTTIPFRDEPQSSMDDGLFDMSALAE
jgi:signal transduction histidine kinase